MLNFRIENRDAALEELGVAGIECGAPLDMHGVGRFTRIHDPEGNPMMLW